MQHEIIFPPTTISVPLPQSVTFSLGNTAWWKLISIFYSFVITGNPFGTIGYNADHLYDMQLIDSSGNVIYQERINRAPSASTAFTAQTIGGSQEKQENSLVTPVAMPSSLLAPPNSSIVVLITSNGTTGAVGPFSDTIAATIVAQDI